MTRGDDINHTGRKKKIISSASYSRVSARPRLTVAIASAAKRIPGPKSRYVPRGVLGPYKGIWGSSCLDPMRFTHSRVRPSARYDGRRRVARFSSPLYAVDGGANGERLAFLPVGRFSVASLSLSLALCRSISLYLILFLGGCSSRRTPVVISKKIPFSRLRPKKFHRARRLLANGGGKPECGTLVGSERGAGTARVKVRNVAGREIASFPNPLCVF